MRLFLAFFSLVFWGVSFYLHYVGYVPFSEDKADLNTHKKIAKKQEMMDILRNIKKLEAFSFGDEHKKSDVVKSKKNNFLHKNRYTTKISPHFGKNHVNYYSDNILGSVEPNSKGRLVLNRIRKMVRKKIEFAVWDNNSNNSMVVRYNLSDFYHIVYYLWESHKISDLEAESIFKRYADKYFKKLGDKISYSTVVRKYFELFSFSFLRKHGGVDRSFYSIKKGLR